MSATSVRGGAIWWTLTLRKGRHGVFAGKTVWSMPERFEICLVYEWRYINTLLFLSFPLTIRGIVQFHVVDFRTTRRLDCVVCRRMVAHPGGRFVHSSWWLCRCQLYLCGWTVCLSRWPLRQGVRLLCVWLTLTLTLTTVNEPTKYSFNIVFIPHLGHR